MATGITIPWLKQHTVVELAHMTFEAHRLGLMMAGGTDDQPDDTNQEDV